MPDARPTVFVVDDDVSVRESLEALIEFAGWEARTFSSAGDFLEEPLSAGAICLVLDISLPDLNGLDIQTRLARERPDIPIIFLTGFGDVPMTVRASGSGISAMPVSGAGAAVPYQTRQTARFSASARSVFSQLKPPSLSGVRPKWS